MAESTAVVDTSEAPVPQSKVDQFVAEVLPPLKWDQLAKELPIGVRPEVFRRNLTNAVMKNPKLLTVDPRKVYREVSYVAALGLLLDPHLQECWLIVDSKGEVQARIGYRGLLKLTRQSDEVSFAAARDICANDFAEIELGTRQQITHKIDPKADRGDPASYYAIVQFKDGSVDFELMSLTQVYKIRDRSDGYRAFKAGKIKTTPWASDEEEMAKKTVLRRLCKRLPMAPDKADLIAQMLEREDAAEFSEFRQGLIAPPQSPLARRALERSQVVDATPEPGMNGAEMERTMNGEPSPQKKPVAKPAETDKSSEKQPAAKPAAQGAGDTSPVASNSGAQAAPAPAPSEKHDPETGEITEDPPWDEGDPGVGEPAGEERDEEAAAAPAADEAPAASEAPAAQEPQEGLEDKARAHAQGWARKQRARRVPAEFASVKDVWLETYDNAKAAFDAALKSIE